MAMHPETAIPSTAFARFEREFRGAIITPTHPAYPEARLVWNGIIDRRPRLIARPSDPADVAAVVRLAREEQVPFAIRGGGHNVAGSAVCEGGIVCDLSGLRAVHVDAAARTARAQGGATWADFDRATHAIGMATTGGMVSSTGIGGLTLGGGLGWLMRAHGLACDQLVRVDLVTADGASVSCSAADHPDLFWAVRGGGGNFGVATSLTYRLHPVDVVMGGLLIYPLERAIDVLHNYHEYCQDTPDQVTTAAAFATAPTDVAAFPEALWGRPICMIALCAIGASDAVQKMIEPLRRFGPPAADFIGPVSYPALQSSLDGGSPPFARNYWKAGYLKTLSPDLIRRLVDHFARTPSPMAQVLIHQIGGAVARVDEQATAFPHRTSPYLINVVGMWKGRADDAANVEWTRTFWSSIKGETSGTYVNYLGEDEGQVESIYPPETLRRLRLAKASWDPDNFFRANHNVPPAR
jgi:hypothetical protein